MRLERLNYNKIKIFLTFDDLVERGLTKEDLWYNAPKVQQLFRDMMEEANKELGFELDGVLAVEVFSLQAQGMVVIITKESATKEEQDEYFDNEFIEMQVTLDESHDIVYSFQSFEDVIALATCLSSLGVEEGQLIYFENKYYLYMNAAVKSFEDVDQLIAILAEFGDSSMISIHRLLEYGNIIMKQKAMQQIYKYFIKQ
ncbi:MAG: genetic competence negative regulator [Bacillaceae bacterium]